MNRQRWSNVVLGLLTVLTVVVVALAIGDQRGPSADLTAAPVSTASAVSTGSPRAAASGTGPRAVFIGDSYTAGTAADREKWTTIVATTMGWREVNLGRGGTGYVTSVRGDGARAACGLDSCPAYAGMVKEAIAADPAVIVVSGGRNDGKASVTNAALALFLELHKQAPKAKIIVVSPLWDDDPAPADLAGTKQGVRVAARSAGVQYLDISQPLFGNADLVASDGVQPNDAGHKAIADAVVAELK